MVINLELHGDGYDNGPVLVEMCWDLDDRDSRQLLVSLEQNLAEGTPHRVVDEQRDITVKTLMKLGQPVLKDFRRNIHCAGIMGQGMVAIVSKCSTVSPN